MPQRTAGRAAHRCRQQGPARVAADAPVGSSHTAQRLQLRAAGRQCWVAGGHGRQLAACRGGRLDDEACSVRRANTKACVACTSAGACQTEQPRHAVPTATRPCACVPEPTRARACAYTHLWAPQSQCCPCWLGTAAPAGGQQWAAQTGAVCCRPTPPGACGGVMGGGVSPGAAHAAGGIRVGMRRWHQHTTTTRGRHDTTHRAHTAAHTFSASMRVRLRHLSASRAMLSTSRSCACSSGARSAACTSFMRSSTV